MSRQQQQQQYCYDESMMMMEKKVNHYYVGHPLGADANEEQRNMWKFLDSAPLDQLVLRAPSSLSSSLLLRTMQLLPKQQEQTKEEPLLHHTTRNDDIWFYAPTVELVNAMKHARTHPRLAYANPKLYSQGTPVARLRTDGYYSAEAGTGGKHFLRRENEFWAPATDGEKSNEERKHRHFFPNNEKTKKEEE